MGQLKMDLYIRNLQRRYLVASKREKTMILNEFCETSGYHRKHAIRILKDDDGSEADSTAKQKRGRKPIYAEEGLLEALRNIWLQTDFMCSKRLKAAIPLWLLSYETHYGPLEPVIRLHYFEQFNYHNKNCKSKNNEQFRKAIPQRVSAVIC